MLKNWLRKKKAHLMFKWAQEFGLQIVRIQSIGGTEYIVDKNGSLRKLAKQK